MTFQLVGEGRVDAARDEAAHVVRHRRRDAHRGVGNGMGKLQHMRMQQGRLAALRRRVFTYRAP